MQSAIHLDDIIEKDEGANKSEGVVESIGQQVSQVADPKRLEAAPSQKAENAVAHQLDNVESRVSGENSTDRLASTSINTSALSAPPDSQSRPVSVSNTDKDDYSVNLKVFVGGLFSQTEEDVNSYFKKFGEIVE